MSIQGTIFSRSYVVVEGNVKWICDWGKISADWEGGQFLRVDPRRVQARVFLFFVFPDLVLLKARSSKLMASGLMIEFWLWWNN